MREEVPELGVPEKMFLIQTETGQAAVQSDDWKCIMELAIAFSGRATVLKREANGSYRPLTIMEMEAYRCRLSS